MKKKIFAGLSALALVLSMPFIPASVLAENTASDVKINETNFPDETFRGFVKKFDKNSNGILSDTEVAVVTNINLSGQGISSLKGIEYFTSLIELSCSENQLVSLDLSQNKLLEKLECYSNQLTSLNVRNDTNLKILYCYNNQLTSLNLRNNTNLEKLYCYSNQLVSLDVSQDTALKELVCSSNQLTSLDISKNTALFKLNCPGNKIESLDSRNNKKLMYLYCVTNQNT